MYHLLQKWWIYTASLLYRTIDLSLYISVPFFQYQSSGWTTIGCRNRQRTTAAVTASCLTFGRARTYPAGPPPGACETWTRPGRLHCSWATALARRPSTYPPISWTRTGDISWRLRSRGPGMARSTNTVHRPHPRSGRMVVAAKPSTAIHRSPTLTLRAFSGFFFFLSNCHHIDGLQIGREVSGAGRIYYLLIKYTPRRSPWYEYNTILLL